MNEEVRILVNRCLEGQQSALVDFVRRFQDRVYAFCYRILRQHEDAEDATQETLIRVLKNLHRWDQQRDVEPWLFTIACNRCRTQLAKRKRTPTEFSLEFPVSDRSVEKAMGEQLVEEINLALKSIRDDHSRAFVSFHRDGLSYDEIAERMDVPIGTVKTWVHRGRREIIGRLLRREVIWENNRELSRVRESHSGVARSAS
ncbi:MAG TPA: RNA polymerase sigma factor [Pirellulaceae bacterium]|nr:RNA polymerase sigma factor [Pirellulaceae bacterium]HMO94045.1 RNA polymerase sigma factor [Pirellulaceae bacterium]HMP70915.1 RNA polymerase sigma factor [Pirellulaceae bacterium]